LQTAVLACLWAKIPSMPRVSSPQQFPLQEQTLADHIVWLTKVGSP